MICSCSASAAARNFAAADLAIQPKYLARLNDSFKPPYDALPPYSRPLFKMPRTNEAIHESVRLRHEAGGGHAPANLARWLEPGTNATIEPSDPDWQDVAASAAGAAGAAR